MIFKQHYSSSEGNLYTLESGDSRIIIECGVSWKRLQKALDYKLNNVDFCLVSHEHGDHCESAEKLLKARIGVYASEGTIQAASGDKDVKDQYILTSLVVTHIDNGKWSVFPFQTHHDCEEPQGFVISDGAETMLFATDTRFILEHFNQRFDIIAIECNYDKDIISAKVESGEINEELAKRISKNHMEKSATLSYLQKHCDLTKCREIHLIHMSKDNLNKSETVKEFEETLMIKVVTV